jgi:hypothetical protein
MEHICPSMMKLRLRHVVPLLKPIFERLHFTCVEASGTAIDLL